jgi:uncharacterized protein (TIGR03083 family)
VTPYLQVAVRVRDLVRTATKAVGDEASVSGRQVPACPGWTVHDLVAHLSGVADDVLAGNVADAGRPAWTHAQVQAGHEVALDALLDRWVAAATRMAGTAAGPAAAQMTMDAITHEIDLRHTLGAPLPDSDLTQAIGWLVVGFDGVLRRRGLPALQIIATGPGEPRTWLLPGTPGSEATRSHDGTDAAAGPTADRCALLAGSQVDLLRSLTGRRTREQVLALITGTDTVPADDWWRAFTWGPFTPPSLTIESGPTNA